jgi:hypothetical protein
MSSLGGGGWARDFDGCPLGNQWRRLDVQGLLRSDQGCFSASSYGGIVNNCNDARWISTSLAVPSGWNSTSVSIFGNNSMCMTVSTNGVGNGAHVGADTWTLGGPKTWQTLNTGNRFVWDWSPVVFRCLLEGGGVIGSFTAAP